MHVMITYGHRHWDSGTLPGVGMVGEGYLGKKETHIKLKRIKKGEEYQKRRRDGGNKGERI